MIAAALLLSAGICAANELPPKLDLQPKNAEPEAVFSETSSPKAPVAQAIALAFGSTFFAEVRVSTMGAVTDLSRLAADGFYKRELITLLLISAKTKTPLAELAAKRKKGEKLRKLAEERGLKYDEVQEAALTVERDVDARYLKRYPERRPRRARDE